MSGFAETYSRTSSSVPLEFSMSIEAVSRYKSVLLVFVTGIATVIRLDPYDVSTIFTIEVPTEYPMLDSFSEPLVSL